MQNQNIIDLTIPKPFQIKVQLFELRQLQCPEEGVPAPNPYVVVKVFNIKIS